MIVLSPWLQADIRPQTDGCNGLRYNLTSDIIESIFRTYPTGKICDYDLTQTSTIIIKNGSVPNPLVVYCLHRQLPLKTTSHEIHLEISNRFLISFKTRFDQVVFTRCHIGDTRLTHACLLKGEDPTQCMFCKIPLSVKHILLDCPTFNVCRKLFYEVNSLKDLFSINLPEKVLEFLSYVNVKNLV